MFGKSIRLFTLFGFDVKVDASWLLLAILITWTLAQGLFPYWYEDFSPAVYWWMGLAGALGLFASIVFHELSHSLVARRHGLPMKGITLFIFGGVAEMDREPSDPKAEFFMAIAGPIASILIGLVFLGFTRLSRSAGWPEPVGAVLEYLGWINLVLAAFNMLPAFPLDGGRVLRSALWYWKANLQQATRIASRIGSAFGVLLIALGVLFFLQGNLIGGIWWFMIGMFLRGASSQSHKQLLIRRALEGESVERFMNKSPLTVSPELSLSELVEDYIYEHHYKLWPVMEGGQLVGCITTRDVKNVPREEWSSRPVGQTMNQCDPSNTIERDADAMKALSRMSSEGASRLMVIDRGKLVGVLALKDLLEFLTLKLDLEEDPVPSDRSS